MSVPWHKEQQMKESKKSIDSKTNAGKLPDHIYNKSDKELLSELLSCIRAISWLHQSLHWQFGRANNYALHLLFERLYNNTLEEIDVLAEKIFSYHGYQAIEKYDQAVKVSSWLKRWSGYSVETAIRAEKELQLLLSYIYKKMKSTMTLGLDDFIMNVANNHETHLYLLEGKSE